MNLPSYCSRMPLSLWHRLGARPSLMLVPLLALRRAQRGLPQPVASPDLVLDNSRYCSLRCGASITPADEDTRARGRKGAQATADHSHWPFTSHQVDESASRLSMSVKVRGDSNLRYRLNTTLLKQPVLVLSAPAMPVGYRTSSRST